MISFNILDNENISVDNNVITLPTAFQCKLSLQILIDNTPSLLYQLTDIIGNFVEVKTTKSFITDNDNIILPTVDLYVNENMTNTKRYFYMSIKNNESDEQLYITLIQPECNFQIFVTNEKGGLIIGNNITFKELDETQTVKVSVYGASRQLLFNNNLIDIISKTDELYPNDNGIFVTLSKYEQTDYYNSFLVKITFLGKYSNINNYLYRIPFIHKDNVSTVEYLTVSFDYKEETLISVNNKINNWFLENHNYTTIAEYNDDAKDAKLPYIFMIIANQGTLPPQKAPLAEVESIELIGITDNVITIRTNVYGEDNALEHDSMLYINIIANWCNAKDNYYDELHHITITCNSNYSQIDKRCRMIVSNAESNNKNLFFLITQTGDNITTIEQVSN